MKLSRIFRGDKVIWMVFLVLSIISLVAVFSSIGLYAYSSRSQITPQALFMRHLLVVAVTYVVVILLSHVNYRYFSRFAVLAYWAILVLLLVMFVLGGRWMRNVPIVGQFQPSEIAKVVLIIFVSRLMAIRNETTDDFGTFCRLLLAIAPVVVLILPMNFSTAALVLVSSYFVMLYGGANKKYWWRVAAAGVLVVGIGMFVAYTRYEKQLYQARQTETEQQFLQRSTTWGHRIYSWVHPITESEDGKRVDLYTQENMAKMAIARGGVFGQGVGNTIHARLITQAHNDFIYAIIIEETGIVGGAVVFILYAIFYFRCIRLAGRCKGKFGSLAVAGLGTMIYLQALLNMAVATGLIPVTGQTLPFISFGGTAYVFLGMGLGVIQSVAADVEKQEKSQVVVSEEVIEGVDDNNEEQEKQQA